MPPGMQAKLLRVLAGPDACSRVGGDARVTVDVRVIAATNRDLRDAGRPRRASARTCTTGWRRADSQLPPLRERRDDIAPLARHFLASASAARGKRLRRARARSAWRCTPGRATCASWRTWSSARRSWPGATGSISSTWCSNPLPRAGDEPGTSLDDAEREAIRRVLVETGGNRGRAAAALGISPRTLRHKLKGYRDGGRPIEEAG